MSHASCLEYLDQWGDYSFREVPFCQIDSLILSMCIYAGFEGILPTLGSPRTMAFSQAAEVLSSRPGWDHTGPLMSQRIPRLVEKAARSRRFASLPLGRFQSKLDDLTATQFAAATWFLPDGTLYVSFRGTDDTLTGWKESFRMAFSAPIPAQELAEEYLRGVAEVCPGRLRLGGHSKGGNLAVWAAVHAQPMVRRRILRIDSFDGPGLLEDLTSTPAYRALEPRLFAVAPQSSLVGALLHQYSQCRIIRSHGVGIKGQHNPFTWELQEKDFRPHPQRSAGTRRAAQALHTWVAAMPRQEMEEFVDLLFDLLSANDARTLTDLIESPGDSVLNMVRAYKALPLDQRRELRASLRLLLASL